jgi:outer membrane immunogenic protein
MKTPLLRALAFASLAIGGTAMAADMPVKALLATQVSFPNWTGLYVGLNAGYAWSRASMDPVILAPNCVGQPACPALLAAMSSSQSMTSNAFAGGFQAGANKQSGPWVIGIEADIETFRLRNGFAFGPIRPTAGFPVTLTSSGSVDTNWLATLRPRVGVTFANVLVYATGGLAFTNQNNTLNDLLITTGGGGFTGTIGAFNVTSSPVVGWTAGGGIEYALAPRWSLKAEYLHVDFGSASGAAPATNLPPPALCPCGFTAAVLTATTRLTANLVRVGLNFRFAQF